MDNKFKINSQSQQEISKYFNPKSEIVTKLPEKANDLSEKLIKNSDGTFTVYQMVEGNWMVKGTLNPK